MNMEQRLLNEAAFNGDLNTVKELVEQGYDVNFEHFNGVVTRSPLDDAIENERLDVIKYLVENGAEINRKSEFGTPLHHAIDIELEHPNWLDDQGNMRPPPAIITKVLIDLGADVNFKDANGTTPLDAAIGRGHIHAEHILRENGSITCKSG